MSGRNLLRGKQLEPSCYKANLSTNEYGVDDKRKFCYGLIDLQTDELLKKCRSCKANVINAEPPKEDTSNDK